MVNATTEFLERQVEACKELIENKDRLIIRLQDENSSLSQKVHTVKSENRNTMNTLREYILECLSNDDISQSVAEEIASICDFELTTEVTVTVSVEYEIQMQVPIGEDAESIVNDIDFETVSYNSDYITWFNAQVNNISIDS